MKKIIALRGKGNSGKSSTLRILHDLLEDDKGFKKVWSKKKEKPMDFDAVFLKKDILIGITSRGDTYNYVHKHLQILVDNKCIICVCACRTVDRKEPGTIAAIKEFKDYQHQFEDKIFNENYTKLHDTTNKNDAQKLHSILNNLIDVTNIKPEKKEK